MIREITGESQEQKIDELTKKVIKVMNAKKLKRTTENISNHCNKEKKYIPPPPPKKKNIQRFKMAKNTASANKDFSKKSAPKSKDEKEYPEKKIEESKNPEISSLEEKMKVSRSCKRELDRKLKQLNVKYDTLLEKKQNIGKIAKTRIVQVELAEDVKLQMQKLEKQMESIENSLIKNEKEFLKLRTELDNLTKKEDNFCA